MENVRKHRDIKKENRKKKKVFGVRTKLLYWSVFTENLLTFNTRIQ